VFAALAKHWITPIYCWWLQPQVPADRLLVDAILAIDGYTKMDRRTGVLCSINISPCIDKAFDGIPLFAKNGQSKGSVAV
jgi:hypothetical protein